MRIGFDAKRAFNNRAGLGNFSRNTINSLSRFYPDDEYVLFSPKTKGDIYTPPVGTQLVLPENLWWKVLSPAWRRYHLSKLANRKKIDIFHGLSHELPVGIERTDCKSLVTIHDLIFIRYPEYYKEADRQIYLKKFRHACEMSDRIHAISQQTRSDIVEFFGIPERKIEVIYQSCNPIYFQPVSEELKQKVRVKFRLPANFLLNVGTVERRKNLLHVLKALVSSGIGLPLVVAGRQTSYMSEIDGFIQQNKNRLNVLFLTGASDQELAALYQMAGMLVYPSVFEGFGLPVIEAQASGCPVITSRSSSMPEAGGDGAVYVNPVDSDDIAQNILSVYSDPELRQSIAAKGRENALRFTPEVYSQQLHKLYQRLYDV